MRAADTGFQHPAAPDRHIPLPAVCLDPARLAVTRDSPELDVDDPAGFKFECLPRVLDAENRFVETDRRADPGLQLRMIDDVVISQRLLDQHEIEFVQPAQHIDVIQCIGRVGIHRQLDLRIFLSDGLDHLVIATRFDLQFDALVSGRQLRLDLP